MRELGAIAPAEHARVGELVADAGVAVLVTVGPGTDELARGRAGARRRGARASPTGTPRSTALRALVEPGDAVLVKASRLVGLERVAEALLQTREDAS